MKKIGFLLIVSLVILSYRATEAQVPAGKEDPAKGDTVKAHMQKAQLLISQGKTDEASKVYIGIIESDPNNREAVQGYIMANAKHVSGGEGALKLVEDLGMSYPENTAVVFWKAFIKVNLGLNEEALIDVEKLIKIYPDDALNHILKGQTLSKMLKHDEAFQSFDRATSIDPGRWDVWGMKAGSLAKMGRFEEAIIAINKGVEIAPEESVNIYNRACIFCLKGDKTNALADLQKAISMNPFFKDNATKDEDFKSLYDDEDFKRLTRK